MKKLLTAILLALVVLCSVAKGAIDPLMSSDTIVWAGLDYSLVRMICGNNFNFGFNVPGIIFPGMLEKWNQLFLDERIELVASSLGKKVALDISGVTARNKLANEQQIISVPGSKDSIQESHIGPSDIAVEVSSYKMEKTNGLGLVFIVDRLVSRSIPGQTAHTSDRQKSEGAVYIVFFDIATRRIISSERQVHSVSSGGNFRNFWFGPIKDSDETLRKYRGSYYTVPPTRR